MEPLPQITTEELLKKIERADDLVLVDALAPMIYAHSHLPGAINMPPTQVDAVRCAKRMPALDSEIVVYCSNVHCDDSIATARKLRELGYTNVLHYAGGKDEWRERGLALERAGRPYVPS